MLLSNAHAREVGLETALLSLLYLSLPCLLLFRSSCVLACLLLVGMGQVFSPCLLRVVCASIPTMRLRSGIQRRDDRSGLVLPTDSGLREAIHQASSRVSPHDPVDARFQNLQHTFACLLCQCIGLRRFVSSPSDGYLFFLKCFGPFRSVRYFFPSARVPLARFARFFEML